MRRVARRSQTRKGPVVENVRESSPELSPAAKLWALFVSLFIVGVGVTWTWKVGQDSNNLAHKLGHKMEGLEEIRTIVGVRSK